MDSVSVFALLYSASIYCAGGSVVASGTSAIPVAAGDFGKPGGWKPPIMFSCAGASLAGACARAGAQLQFSPVQSVQSHNSLPQLLSMEQFRQRFPQLRGSALRSGCRFQLRGSTFRNPPRFPQVRGRKPASADSGMVNETSDNTKATIKANLTIAKSFR